MRHIFKSTLAAWLFLGGILLAAPPINNPTFNGYTSNQVIVAATTAPTNTYTLATLVSGTVGTHIITTTGSGFANVHQGDNIVVNVNQQYTIIYKDSSSQVHIFEGLASTLTGATATIYPNAIHLRDINFHDSGYIDNAGGIGVDTAHSYGITLSDGATGTTGWRISDSYPGTGAFIVNAYVDGLTQNPDIFHLWKPDGNFYQALEVRPNGMVSTPYGFTNSITGGAIHYYVPINTDYQVVSTAAIDASGYKLSGNFFVTWFNNILTFYSGSQSNYMNVADSTGIPVFNTFQLATNSDTTLVDLNIPKANVQTNAAFAWVGFKNKPTLSTATASRKVFNSTGSAVLMTMPANVHVVGTGSLYVTNYSYVTFEYDPNIPQTNVIVAPIY